MIYLIPFMAMMAGCYYYDYSQKSKGRLFCWILLLITLICISGFRYMIGTDSIKYENYYHWQHTLSQLRADDFKDTRFAPLYIILSTVCRTITYDFMLLQFVVSITINTAVFYFFWKNTKHIFFAAMIYYVSLYINLNMEVIREAIAVSVFLCAWPYFREGKWIKYYVLSVVAFLFHVSALVMFILPLFWLPGVRWIFTFGARTWMLCIGVLLGSFVMQLFFFDFIQLVAITENMAERAVVYSKSDLSGSTLNILGVLSQVIQYVAYPLLALYFLRKQKIDCDDKDKQYWLKREFMTMIAVYVALLTTGIMIFLRYKNYFFFFSMIAMSDWVFSLLKVKGNFIRLKLVHWVLIFLPLFGFQLYAYWSDYNKSGTIKTYQMYYPYSNRFDQKIDPERQKAIRYSRKL